MIEGITLTPRRRRAPVFGWGNLLLLGSVTTGVLPAVRHGVTWESLAQPGYGRVLAAELLLFTFVMAAATVHGIAQARGATGQARTASRRHDSRLLVAPV